MTEVEIAPPPPPVEVLFTAPTEGETDVRLGERVRMQLSRDLDPASLKDRVRITYAKDIDRTSLTFVANYTRENRALEIRLERAVRTVSPGADRVPRRASRAPMAARSRRSR